jgi:hypothetical protein
MIRIAHRGNYNGKNILRENTKSYIEEAIEAGYDVEVDAWLIGHSWHLGHDFPGETVPLSFFERANIWTHAKNLIGYVSLYNNPKVHTFWHDKDDFVYTNKGIKWAHAGIVTYDGVVVMPELSEKITKMLQSGEFEPLGICSDNFDLFNPDSETDLLDQGLPTNF